MKIHSDTLTYADVHLATIAGGMRGVYAEKLERHGSRSRDHSYDVTLRGNSTRKPNPGTGWRDPDADYAATWDEWGMFIQALYVADPKALIGQYGPASVFEEATAMRFEDLTAAEACPRHNWKYDGPVHVATCSKCGATNNYNAVIAYIIAEREAKALRSVN